MDISVNKPAKEYLKRKFEQWYAEQVMQQLDGREIDDLEEAELEPIELGMPLLKEVGAKWLVEMAEYISDNPQFVVHGFIQSGISGAIEGQDDVYDIGSNDNESGDESSDTSEEETES